MPAGGGSGGGPKIGVDTTESGVYHVGSGERPRVSHVTERYDILKLFIRCPFATFLVPGKRDGQRPPDKGLYYV